MARCSFCRETIDRGTGTMLVKNDGKILFFCSSKCDKNMMKLGREPRHVRWTGAFAREKKQSKAGAGEVKE
ncbi:MAG: 50S ribosomal protein L24e [Candidatus Aenigmarchaeota archaeon]|nr:50S ribosomal protein L24e [Candidatus Aenigmarchaeota archaeon]